MSDCEPGIRIGDKGKRLKMIYVRVTNKEFRDIPYMGWQGRNRNLQSLAEAWRKADMGNANALERAFPDLVEKYIEMGRALKRHAEKEEDEELRRLNNKGRSVKLGSTGLTDKPGRGIINHDNEKKD